MATPPPEHYQAALHDFAGTTIAELVRANVSGDQPILDVGAGWGKYSLLLPEYTMDAVEAWEPYVGQNDLTSLYARVFVTDIQDFTYPHRYGAVIFGDVLEHISVEGAQRVIELACDNADHVFVAVPFLMPQDECDGNHHEEHLQADLTAKLMAKRYPQLQFYDSFSRPGQHEKAVYTEC